MNAHSHVGIDTSSKLFFLCFFLMGRDDKVEPLEPPQGSKPGDKVFVEGFDQSGWFKCYCATIMNLSYYKPKLFEAA